MSIKKFSDKELAAEAAPGPDQLDVEAEVAAVSAINWASNAIRMCETFDAISRKHGVFDSEALDALIAARGAVGLAIQRAEEAGRVQAQANEARTADRVRRGVIA